MYRFPKLFVKYQGLALVFIFAAMHWSVGLDSAGAGVGVDLSTAIYFSVVTWTTLGYGDFAPVKDLQLIAAFEAGLGLVFFGVFVGVAVHWLNTRMTRKHAKRK